MRPALFAIALVSLLPAALSAQQPSLTKLWETDTVVAVPESVLPDPANNILYVSLVDGAPWDKDGKGGVGRLSPDGKQYNGNWITGLNAPKGMGRYGDLIVSEWIGNVFYVYADGRKVQMLDRKPEKKNTADIWYDQKTKTLYVPGFFGKTITAYHVNI
jgi:hypothetical protein